MGRRMEDGGDAAAPSSLDLALARAESLASAVLDSVTDGILVVTRTGRIVRVNAAAEGILGFPAGSLVGRSISELVPPEQRAAHAELVRRFHSVGPHVMGAHRQLQGVRHDGALVPLEVTLTELPGDGPAQVCAVVRDVTERLRLEQQLLHQSLHDPLTGLANRASLRQRLDEVLARIGRHGGSVALLLMDVDHFKEVNDSLGHAVGDAVLVALAESMAAVVRADDLLARLGGDEFAVVVELQPGESIDAVLPLAHRLRAAAASSVVAVDGAEVRPTLSIGVHVAQAPSSWAALLADADIGLYDAKAAGRDQVRVFHPGLRAGEARAHRLRAQLRSAIEVGELEVHYQPIQDLAAGRFTALEALVRWPHPGDGLLLPGEFLPFADRNGLMRDIDRFVLRRSLADIRRAQRERPGIDEVWVNLSVQSISDPGLVEDVLAAVADSGCDASMLVLEITEDAVLVEGSAAVGRLLALAEAGVRLAVDDFGTGYSSLAQLGSLPLSAVKLDRSLVGRPSGSRLLASIVGVVDALGLRPVAEGVETLAQRSAAADAGCTHAQGYAIARPAPLDGILSG